MTEFPNQSVRAIATEQKAVTAGSGPEVCRVADILQAVCSAFDEKLRDARIRVTQNYHRDAVVASDSDDLRQVFNSLISNAIDAMPNGGSLRLEIHADQEVVQIVIADTGHGILADKEPHIFQPFYTTKGEKSIGIGLWIARNIIEKAGGSIELESLAAETECGARFRIRLPAADTPSHELDKRGAA